MKLPQEQMNLVPGQLLMDTRQGCVAYFVGYTPEHPEFVARVRYAMSSGGRRVGVRPFELERFRIVGETLQQSDEAWPVDAPIARSWDAAVRELGIPAAPRKKARAKAPAKQPQPTERTRRIDLDA